MTDPMQFGDYSSAQQTHSIIGTIVRKILSIERPLPRLGTVTGPYNDINQQVAVTMNGDVTPTQATALPSNFPFDVGSIVSVKGGSGRGQQVDDIFKGRRGMVSPALIKPVYAGSSANGYETYKSSYYSNQGNASAGNAWYYGRWISTTTIGLADIVITYTGNASEFISTYRIPLLYNETGLGTWVRVHPDTQTYLTAGLEFQLEVMLGIDPITGEACFDVRVRTLGLDPGGTSNTRFTMDLYGGWTQSISESAWLGTPTWVTAWFPTTWLNPYQKWNILNSQNTPSLAGTWVDYDGGVQFPPARFYQDAKGKVRFSGLVRAGAAGAIFTLPAILCPDTTLTFDGNSSGVAGQAEIRVSAGGAVTLQSYSGGSNVYVSLDKIEFFPASVHIPWTNATLTSPWVNVGGAFSTARYYIDEDGICHWTGLISGGAASGVIATAAANAGIGMDTLQDIFCRPASGGMARIDISTTQMLLNVFFGSGTNTYVSLDGLSYPATGTTVRWFTSTSTNLGFINGFTNYQAGTWNSYRFCKDSAGVVRISGLIANASTATTGQFNFPLPAGFRPCYEQIYSIVGNPNVLGRIDALPTGGLNFQGLGATGSDIFIGLGDLRWIAES